jgi:hypothetical protein
LGSTGVFYTRFLFHGRGNALADCHDDGCIVNLSASNGADGEDQEIVRSFKQTHEQMPRELETVHQRPDFAEPGGFDP